MTTFCSALGLSRSDFWSRARSSASGTIGVSSGTEPSPSPTSSRCADRAQRQVRPAGQHGARRVGQLAQPGQGTAPQGGQRLGQPGRLDRRGRRRVVALVAQGPGRLHHPRRHHVVGRAEQVGVPARGGDPGAVAGGRRQAGRGPRRPRGRHLRLGQALEAGGVVLERRPGVGVQHRRVERTAHDGDRTVVGLAHVAQHPAHGGLAPQGAVGVGQQRLGAGGRAARPWPR